MDARQFQVINFGIFVHSEERFPTSFLIFF